jgi:hypothetical protein
MFLLFSFSSAFIIVDACLPLCQILPRDIFPPIVLSLVGREEAAVPANISLEARQSLGKRLASCGACDERLGEHEVGVALNELPDPSWNEAGLPHNSLLVIM